MPRKKVYDIILRISPIDRKRLLLFLKSEFCVSSQELRIFGMGVLSEVKSPLSMISEERIWRHSFDGPLNRHKYNSLCSALYKQVKRFLAINAFEGSPGMHLLEVSELNRIGHYAGFSGYTETKLKNVEESASIEGEKFLYRYLIDEQITSFQIKTGAYKKNPESVGYRQMLKNLDSFYLISRYRLEIMIFNLSQIYNLPAPEHDFSNLLQSMPDTYRTDEKAIGLYAEVYDFCTGRSDNFQPILDLLITLKRKKWTWEQYDILILIINRTITLANIGKLEFQASLDLYRWGFANDIFDSLEGMSITDHLKNILKLALKVNEPNFARDFASRYVPQLEEDLKSNFIHYYEASLAYRDGAYHSAMGSLAMVKRNTRFWYYSAQLLSAKVLYDRNEVGDEELLRSLIQTTRMAIGRDKGKMSPQYLTGNRKWFSMIGRLINCNTPAKIGALKRMIADLPGEDQKWFETRIRQRER